MLTDTLESSVQRKSGEETMTTETFSELLHKMDAYWRAGQGLARAKRFVK
jgi:hypothetical protein